MEYNLLPKGGVLFGNDSVMKLGEKVKEFGGSKAFVVYDAFLDDCGVSEKIFGALHAAGVETASYNKVQSDAPEQSVLEAAAVGREFGADTVIGIGGGSALDTAKAVNVMLHNPEPIAQYANPFQPQQPGAVLILVPTTAGTGSEVSSGAMVCLDAGVKVAVCGRNVMSALAVVDPVLTASAPAFITAACGIDAFSHAVSSLTATYNANPVNEALALDVVKRVVEWLPKAVADGSDLIAREQMACASNMAGLAFVDKTLHLDHAIAHAMGAVCHLHHGVCCGIALPPVLEYVAPNCRPQMLRLAEAMGLGDHSADSDEALGHAVADAVRDLLRRLNMPTLKEAGVAPAQFPAIAALAVKDITAMFAPKPADEQAIMAMLEAAYQ